ncbi:helix-turn-helix domain-containing protein [bacterium]|jgi:predicted site-specific integrase-resolvase|nr:helix-turn-helix domain-containing protein [bacterium]
MIQAILDPRTVFDRAGLCKTLAVKPSTLSREIRNGRLKAHSISNRDYFFGEDVIAWMKTKQRPTRPIEDELEIEA